MQPKDPTGHEPEQPYSGSSLLLIAAVFTVLLIGVMVAFHLPSKAAAAESAAVVAPAASVADGRAALAAGQIDRARRIFQGLASAGNIGAAYQLGLMYEVGGGDAAPDIARAAHWYRKAAAGGLIAAKAHLGHLYLEGVGVLQDFVAARQLLYPAADDGEAQAGFDLGRLWEHGWGGEKNLPLAYAYYEFAARQHLEAALKARDALLAKLTPAEITEGQSLLKELHRQMLHGAKTPQVQGDSNSETPDSGTAS
jgi:TPR repeat protein